MAGMAAIVALPSTSMAAAGGAGVKIRTVLEQGGVIERVAVFGKDDRAPLASRWRGLQNAIGLVASEAERTMCTGFCIGRRTIATAAHCLFRTSGERRPDLASFRFIVGVAGKRRSSPIMGQSSASPGQFVIAGATDLSVAPPIDATRDWALARLTEPVCAGNGLEIADIEPTRVHRLAARGRLLHVAFHGDLGDWHLTGSSRCATQTQIDAQALSQIGRDFTDVSRLVLHECDTGLASSGSPLLTLSPDNRIRVVAMNVGTYQQTRYLVSGTSVKHRYKPATVANTAVSASAFSGAALAFARADILTDPRSIRRLQVALDRLRLEPGPIDGIFGNDTRSAVKAFERLTKRPALGLATRELLRDAEYVAATP